MRTVRFTADLTTPDPVTCRYCGRELQRMPYVFAKTSPWGLARDQRTHCAYRKADFQHEDLIHEALPSTGVYGDPTEDGRGETLEPGWWNPRWTPYEVSQHPEDALVETYDDQDEHKRHVESRHARFGGGSYHVIACACGNESQPLFGYDHADDVLSDTGITLSCDPGAWLAAIVTEWVGAIDDPEAGGATFYAADSQEDYTSGVIVRPAAHAEGFTKDEIAVAVEIMKGK